MRGKKQAKKREIKPDKKYNSTLIAEFINKVLLRGQKETAQNLVYRALDIVSEKMKKDPLEIFNQAARNASPLLEVRSKRIGGATYQVPMEVADHRKIDLVLRWLVGAARGRQGKSKADFLADEIIAMHKREGAVIKKKEDLHKMAEANRAFAHFARF